MIINLSCDFIKDNSLIITGELAIERITKTMDMLKMMNHGTRYLSYGLFVTFFGNLLSIHLISQLFFYS